MSTPARLLITGATGFIGHAVCREAIHRGHSVLGTCRDCNKLPAGIVHVPIPDINETTDWTGTLRDIDIIIHLAARAHIMHDTAADPLQEFRRINTAATLHLARAAAKAGVRRFVFISSIKVNGEKTLPGQPFRETDTPHPEDPYGISKWEAEQGLMEIGKATGMQIVILRPPLVYGPDVKGNFAQLLRVMEKPLPLPLGSIRNQRSLIYLGNLVDVILLCATHPAAANQTYLVSDGNDVATPDLIRLLAVKMQVKPLVIPCPVWMLRLMAGVAGKSAQLNRLLDSLQVDIRKLRENTGWHPAYTTDQGMQMTADACLSKQK